MADTMVKRTEALMDIEDFAPFIEGLDHPEGVTWGPDGFIYAGGEAGQIYRITLDGKSVEQVGTTNGFILGLCLDADLNVYACDHGNHAIKRITQSGEVTTYAEGIPSRHMVTPNYCAFDRQGNLYVADSGTWHGNDGCLWRVRPGGETELITDELRAFPNGLCLSPDGSVLYVVVSNLSGIAKLRISADGTVGRPEIALELPRTVPDGVAVDEQGNLYVGCYTPDIIYRMTTDGTVNIVAEDWESVTFATPTNIAFAGEDRKTLVVASLSRWHLTKGLMPIAGAPLNYPKIG
jgi:gluconolactonase